MLIFIFINFLYILRPVQTISLCRGAIIPHPEYLLIPACQRAPRKLRPPRTQILNPKPLSQVLNETQVPPGGRCSQELTPETSRRYIRFGLIRGGGPGCEVEGRGVVFSPPPTPSDK